MENNNVNRKQNNLFGLIIGASFIITNLAFLLSGQNISQNPKLNNVLMLLMIAGTFIGVRKYREEALNGVMTYGRALGACIYMIAIGAFIYGVYTYLLYKIMPGITAQYIEVTDATLREVYANNPMLETLSSMVQSFTSPGTIAASEIFGKIFSGFLFSLLIAGILRKSAPIQQQ